MTRTILHVDMDAFYTSVEQLDDPSLQGRPVIVGADPKGGHGRGVVAACSYEARKFGVRSALPISRAWKLCPEGAYLRPRMDRYMEVSHRVMAVLRQFSDLVEPLSIDEAFVDITGSMALFGSAEQIGRAIKKQILETTGLCASIGAGPNKFVAKIASDLRKPNALVIVENHEVEEFLRDLPISRLWGVGPKTEARLHDMGLRTIADLRKLPREELAHALGSMGDHLYQLSFGIDDRPVVPDWEPKSISSETTFEEDTADEELLIQTLRKLSESVGRRLRLEDYRARRIALKLRYENFQTHTKQISLARSTQGDDDIARLAISLFRQFPLNRKVRLIGVAAGELMRKADGPIQLDLFARPQNRDIVDHTVDEIRDRFGAAALRRGSQLNSK